MPRSDYGDGLTWWIHTRGVVEGAGEVNLANVTVSPTDVDTGVALQVRATDSGDLITLTTNSRGETPPTFRLPRPQANLSAGGNTYLSTTAELSEVDARLAAAEAAAVAAQAAAQAARDEVLALTGGVSIVSRVEALEDAGPYVQAIPGYEPGRQGVTTASSPPDVGELQVGDTFDVVG